MSKLIAIRWKVIKIVNYESTIEINNNFFNISPNRRLFSEFSIPWEHSYVPYLLSPKPKFHKALKERISSQFNINIKEKNFPYTIDIQEFGRQVSLHISIRIYLPGILALTINIADFHADEFNPHEIIIYQQLNNIKILCEIINYIIDLIENTETGTPKMPFHFKPLVNLNNICNPDDFRYNFKKNRSMYIGILIRNDNYKTMDENISDKIVSKNQNINEKSDEEMLLIDKQGILYLTPIIEKKKTKYSRSRVHDLYEIANVIEAFLSIYHSLRFSNEDYADYLLFKILPWIDQPDIVFRKSISNQYIWNLIINELRLVDIKEYTVNEDIADSIKEKSKNFHEFANIKWWEDSNFQYTISRKIKESKGFKLNFLNNEDLEEIIIRDYEEAKRCFNGSNFKSTILLCGSILESILTAVLDKKQVAVYTDREYSDLISSYPGIPSVLDKIMVYYDASNNSLTYYDITSFKKQRINKPNKQLKSLIRQNMKYIDIDRISNTDKSILGNSINDIRAHVKKLISTEYLYNFILYSLVDAVKIFQIITDYNLFSYIDPLRNYRNAIHPGVQIRKSLILNKEIGRISFETVNLLVKYFNR